MDASILSFSCGDFGDDFYYEAYVMCFFNRTLRFRHSMTQWDIPLHMSFSG